MRCDKNTLDITEFIELGHNVEGQKITLYKTIYTFFLRLFDWSI